MNSRIVSQKGRESPHISPLAIPARHKHPEFLPMQPQWVPGPLSPIMPPLSPLPLQRRSSHVESQFRSEVESLRTQLQIKQEKIDNFEAELTVQRQQKENLSSQRLVLQRSLTQRHKQNTSLKSELKLQQEKNKKLSSQNLGLQKSLEQKEKEYTLLESQLKAQQEKHKDLLSQNLTLQRSLEQKGKEFQELLRTKQEESRATLKIRKQPRRSCKKRKKV